MADPTRTPQSLLDRASEDAVELAFWIAAIDAVQIERRIEWVAYMMRQYREVCAMRARRLPQGRSCMFPRCANGHGTGRFCESCHA